MQEPEELFDDLMSGKGRRAKQPNYKFASSKRQRSNKDAALKSKINDRNKAQLLLTASKMPQAILKVSGYCKGAAHTHEHVKYITRHGKLELIISDGSSVKGITAIKELIGSWEVDFGERKNSRDIFKLVLSAPEGSDPLKVKIAASKFLANEFGKSNDYTYALHTDTKKPHVHAVIKMRSYNGKKLDPRKYYIEKLRRDFAKYCREEGIIVEASYRYQRGLNGKSKNTPVLQMRKNNPKNIKVYNKINLTIKQQQQSKPITNVVATRNKTIRAEYIKAAVDLYDLADKTNHRIIQNKYKKAAEILLNFAKNMQCEKRFMAQIIDKISGKKDQEQSITFKAYMEVLVTLDNYKKSIIAKIEQQNSNKNQPKRPVIQSELDFDI